MILTPHSQRATGQGARVQVRDATSSKVVQAVAVLAAELAQNGFTRRGRNDWYRRGEDLIQVVNLQKSRWGDQRYVNLSFWLLRLGRATWPHEVACHVRLRCDDAIKSGRRLHAALDGESRARVDVGAIASGELLPFLRATATVAGLAARKRRALLKRVAVVGKAQRLLGI